MIFPLITDLVIDYDGACTQGAQALSNEETIDPVDLLDFIKEAVTLSKDSVLPPTALCCFLEAVDQRALGQDQRCVDDDLTSRLGELFLTYNEDAFLGSGSARNVCSILIAYSVATVLGVTRLLGVLPMYRTLDMLRLPGRTLERVGFQIFMADIFGLTTEEREKAIHLLCLREQHRLVALITLNARAFLRQIPCTSFFPVVREAYLELSETNGGSLGAITDILIVLSKEMAPDFEQYYSSFLQSDLPPHLAAALAYVSSRLVREKGKERKVMAHILERMRGFVRSPSRFAAACLGLYALLCTCYEELVESAESLSELNSIILRFMSSVRDPEPYVYEMLQTLLKLLADIQSGEDPSSSLRKERDRHIVPYSSEVVSWTVLASIANGRAEHQAIKVISPEPLVSSARTLLKATSMSLAISVSELFRNEALSERFMAELHTYVPKALDEALALLQYPATSPYAQYYHLLGLATLPAMLRQTSQSVLLYNKTALLESLISVADHPALHSLQAREAWHELRTGGLAMMITSAPYSVGCELIAMHLQSFHATISGFIVGLQALSMASTQLTAQQNLGLLICLNAHADDFLTKQELQTATLYCAATLVAGVARTPDRRLIASLPLGCMRFIQICNDHSDKLGQAEAVFFTELLVHCSQSRPALGTLLQLIAGPMTPEPGLIIENEIRTRLECFTGVALKLADLDSIGGDMLVNTLTKQDVTIDVIRCLHGFEKVDAFTRRLQRDDPVHARCRTSLARVAGSFLEYFGFQNED
ncbi:hypothetical protein GMRT_15063 [Giardia muris]|uniref:Uncharacterized protein n=1 Tax=Giardia muris TaxID=5742 RepID=A0A4Z1SML7_GIAMU|nr:hypothetical protein GMRT_15063 [Giardia muris]|eukprot:TNJ26936.1 hypothetical protein GMRT_15063 [Giardia muris]